MQLAGWEAVGEAPGAKFVLIGAPHTSNWDFVLALLTLGALGIEGRWVGKHTIFRWPVRGLMHRLGGIPLNRATTTNFVDRSIRVLEEHDRLALLIAPEGTRSKVEHWRTGFYYIAQGANVPIALGFLDYGSKQAGIGATIIPSGDIDADMGRMSEFYADKVGKRPERKGPIEARPRATA